MNSKLDFLLKSIYPSILDRGKRLFNVFQSKIYVKELNDQFALIDVPSEVRPTPYQVNIHFENKLATCNCPYFMENKLPCKHIASAYYKLLPSTKLTASSLADSIEMRSNVVLSKFNEQIAIDWDQIDLDKATENLSNADQQELRSLSRGHVPIFKLLSNDQLKCELNFQMKNLNILLNHKNNDWKAQCDCKKSKASWCPHIWFVLLYIKEEHGGNLFQYLNNTHQFFLDEAPNYRINAEEAIVNFIAVYNQGNIVLEYRDKSLKVIHHNMDWSQFTSSFPHRDLTFVPDFHEKRKETTYHIIYLWDRKLNSSYSKELNIIPYAAKLNKNGQYGKILKEFNAEFIAKSHHNIVDYNQQEYIVQTLLDIQDVHQVRIPHDKTYSKHQASEKEFEYRRKTLSGLFSDLIGLNNYINTHRRNGGDVNTFTPIVLDAQVVQLKLKVELQDQFILIVPSLILKGKEYGIDMLFSEFFVLDNQTIYPIHPVASVLLYKSFADHPFMKWHREDWENVYHNFIFPLQSYFPIVIDEKLEKFDSKKIECEVSLKIYINEYENGLLIVPAFCYTNDMVYKEMSMDRSKEFYFMMEDQQFYFERDQIYESDMEVWLRSLHPNFSNQLTEHYFYLNEEKVLENNWLFKAFNQFNELQIEILGQKNLKKYNYNANVPSIRIKAGSGIDWLDLDIDVTFGDQKLKLAELRHAILNNQQYVRLGDGTIGVLPEEWINKYLALFKVSKINKEKLEINQFQTTVIDELVYEIDGNEKIIELQEKIGRLQDFREIKKVDIPKNMTATLRDYQINGFHWLRFLHEYGWGGCLADDMGLGKTVQMLTFIQSLVNEDQHFKALVVVPTSLLFNWENEIIKFTPTLKYLLHSGMDRTRNLEVFNDYQVIITTYGLLRRDIELFSQIDFDYAILDESQSIKNPLSQISKAVRLLNANNRIVMTGTPVENSTFDLYSQMDFVNPGMLGNLEHFKTQFANKIDKEQDEETAMKLRKIIYPFILNRKKEIVAKELPAKTETIIYCEMDVQQRKIYDLYKHKIREEIELVIAEQGINNAGLYILKGLTKLRQLCNHPALISDEDFSKSSSVKMNILLEHIEELIDNNKKVLVFSFFSSMLDLVEAKLKNRHISYVKITGETKDRKSKVDEFQNNEDTKIFLISLKAGGTGLNLTAAEYVFLIDPWWNPAVEQQAIDRTHRIGQDKHIFAYKLICKDSIEEKILKLQEKKKAIADDLINIESGVIKKLTKEDVMDLIS